MKPAIQAGRQPWVRWVMQRPLLPLLICTLCALALVYQLPVPQVVNVGEAGAGRAINGFYFSEGEGASSFRWSGATAAISFRGVGNRPWRLRLRVAGLRPQGLVPLGLTVNGHPLPDTQLGGDMRDVEFALSPAQVGLFGNVDVRLVSPTFVAPPDTRQLGVMVASARLEPDGMALVLPPPQVLVGLLLLVLLCYYVLRRWGMPLARASAGALLLACVGIAGVTLDRMATSYYLPWCIAVAGLACAAAGWLRERRWWEWIGLCAVGWAAWRFALRALDFLRTGLPQGDFMIYYNAAKNLRIGAPLYDYASARGIPMGPVYKYPPFFAIITAPATRISPHELAVIWYLLNLGLLLFTLYMILRWLPGTERTHRAWYYLVALGFLVFQPLWEGIIRGQMDVLILACAAGGLLLLRKNSGRTGDLIAGALLAFITMLKVYPGILLLYLLWRRRWAAVVGFLAASAAMIVVSLAGVGWNTMWLYVTQILTVQGGAVPYPENQSFNGFLARLFIPASSVTWYTTVPFPSPMALIFYLLVLVSLLITAWWLGRTQHDGDEEGFEMGYVAMLPLILLIWPISWVHLDTLLLLAYALLLLRELQAEQPSWVILALIIASYLVVAIGNEYTVLVPALQTGPARLLQSYKVYGIMVLWFLTMQAGRRARSLPFRTGRLSRARSEVS